MNDLYLIGLLFYLGISEIVYYFLRKYKVLEVDMSITFSETKKEDSSWYTYKTLALALTGFSMLLLRSISVAIYDSEYAIEISSTILGMILLYVSNYFFQKRSKE